MSRDNYDIIIGLEIHAELKTDSKMFCSCKNSAVEEVPNTNVCPICLAHPGTLPVPNKQAVEWTILIGRALNCKINSHSKFDRKNYFYPDLPKGYQISQYDLPLAYEGYLWANHDKIEITRIHLEEDTGKLNHTKEGETIIDFNRAGVPLIEMVTEPVIPNSLTAKKFCQRYQQILRYLNISNGDMEKGEMRCEANISVQEKDNWKYENGEIVAKEGHKLNPKVELKNLNSFKSVEKGIEYEIERQIKAIKNKEELKQETRGWNQDKEESFSQRTKETAADYRYFPEPDIPVMEIKEDWIKEIEENLVELPEEKILRFKKQYRLEEEDIEVLITDKHVADWYEGVISDLRAWIDASGDDWERQSKKLSKSAFNWISSELFKYLKEDNKGIRDVKFTAENFAELVSLLYQEKINSSAGQKILKVMYEKGGDPSEIMKDLNLEQIDNDGEVKTVVEDIIKKFPEQAEEYKNGKENLLKFFIGQVMAQTKGKANPKKVEEILKEELK